MYLLTNPLSLFFLLALILPGILLAEVQVKIQGVSGELKKNIELYVGKPVNDNAFALDSYVGSLPDNVTRSLQALGYYNSKVSVIRELTGTDNQDTTITVDVDAGPVVTITTIKAEVSSQGESLKNTAFDKALAELPLKVGDALNHGAYRESKDILFDTAQNQGYFDARFSKSEASVNTISNTASVTLEFDAGQRYHFGDVKFENDTFSSQFLERWLPFSPGTPYEAELVAVLTQRLQSSGYFSSVRVRTDRNQTVEKTVPVRVVLKATASNQLGLGVGYATDTGPRAKVTWRRPHHNRHGHSLETSAGVSEIKQEFSSRYKIPKKERPQTDYYQADIGAQNEKTDDYESQLRTINVQRVRETSKLWQESVFLRWEHEKFESADDSETIDLLLPGISWARTRSTGGTNPTRGDHFSVQFLGGHDDLFSDISLFKSVASLKWLYTLKPKHKLILSLDYGAISSDDFDKVPTSHRFYVGGDRSIRGFKYNSISPEDGDGELTGGRYKEVGSIEYDYNIHEKWSLATFVDAGRAFDHFDERYRVGAGVGVRWQSPVGPLRIDLGAGISEDDVPWRFHLSLGPDL